MGLVALWAQTEEPLVLSLAATKQWAAHATTVASTTAELVAAPMAYANPTQDEPRRVKQALAASAAELVAALVPAVEVQALIEVAGIADPAAAATMVAAHAVAVVAEAMVAAAAVVTAAAAVVAEATAAAVAVVTVAADVDKNKTIAAIPNRLPLSSRTST